MISARIPRSRGLASDAALNVLAALLALALAGASCARQGSASQAQPAAEGEGGPAASKAGDASVSSGEEPSMDTRPPAPQAASVSAPKPAPAQAASSLTGHDRFLVLGEGPRIPAADFLIGALASSEADERLAPLTLLRAGIGKLELDPKAFSQNSGRIASLVFSDAYSKAKDIDELRLGAPGILEGGLALRFRLYGDQVSALGQAILHSDGDGGWLIEHFELDRDALSLPRQRFERWEPPLALNP